MRTRVLLTSSIPVVLLSGFLIFSNYKQISYAPRTSKHTVTPGKSSDKGIDGAMQYLLSVRGNQFTKTVDPADVSAAVQQANKQRAFSKNGFPLQWNELGPDNVGGRTRAILIDRNDNKIVYAGSVGGGLWKSTTAGSSWNLTTKDLDNQAITSITQTPNGHIFFGTGELELVQGSNGNGNSGVAGAGVYKATDGGNFTKLPSTDPATAGSQWSRVNSLASDPTNNRVYAGIGNGLYWSEDGGNTWTKINGQGIGTSSCKEVKVASDGTVFAVIGVGLFRSANGKDDYVRVGTTPNPAAISSANNRLSVAIAPTDPKFIYCMASSSNDSRLLAVYKSEDKGDSWTVIGTGNGTFFDILGSAAQGQGYYNNVIAVDPTDKDRVYAGGYAMWIWTKTGGWTQISSTFESFTNTKYLHVDQHAIVFDTKTTPYTIYFGNDGGIFKSINRGESFFSVNRNYSVTQFYGIAADARGRVIGGSQDNGTQYINELGGNTGKSSFEIIGGDGFQAEISRLNPNVFFGGSQYGNYLRSQNSGQSFNTFFDDNLQPRVNSPRAPFNSPIQLWENLNDSSSKFAFGITNEVWMTQEALNFAKTPTWYKLGNIAGPSQTLDFSPNGNVLYVGTENGNLYRISNLLAANYADTANRTIPATIGFKLEQLVTGEPGRTVTGISVDPNDSNTIVVTFGNYGNQDYVLRSSNALAAAGSVVFTNITGTLPRMPVYDVEISTRNSDHIVIATELGVWATENGGANWTEQNTGLGRVATFMLRMYEFSVNDGPVLYAASHGRGFFRSSSLTTPGYKEFSKAPQFELTAFPNPAVDNATLKFHTPDNGKVSISVIDIKGREIFSQKKDVHSGLNNININISAFSAGTYFVRMNDGNRNGFTKLVVVK